MKKLKILMLLLILAMVFTGCGNKDSLLETPDVQSTESSVVTESADVTETSSLSASEPQISETVTPEPQISNSQTQSKSNPTSSKKAETNSTQASPNSTEKKPDSSKPLAKTDPPEETPKSAFAKPFDIATMKSELIAYGNSIGMTHITNFSENFGGGQITPEGTTWLPPQETWMYDSSSAGKLKQDLCDRIKRWKNRGESTYTLWFEKDSNHSGDYIIYVIIG